MIRRINEIVFGVLLIVFTGCTEKDAKIVGTNLDNKGNVESNWSNPILIEGSSVGEIISMAVQMRTMSFYYC